MTLIGVAAAGFLLWLASQLEADGTSGYWTQVGLLAGAGLVMALSQLLGGWTKWGWPRISLGVLLLGFLPALAAGGLVLLHAQPDASGFGAAWAGDLGLGGLADDLVGVLPAIAFALGLVLGFTLDTTGPEVDEGVVVVDERRAGSRPVPAETRAADEPVTAERHELDRERELDRRHVETDRDGRLVDDEHARAADVDGDGRREVVHTGGDEPRRRGLFRR
ncbi:MAG TPA: hypothetical protein VK874_17400 [Gaiellaceae bacterium]|nr:hypothetical protein [Gaiellaceae bacterium]